MSDLEKYGELLAGIDRNVQRAMSGNWQTNGSAASICREIARLAMAAAHLAEEGARDARRCVPALEPE